MMPAGVATGVMRALRIPVQTTNPVVSHVVTVFHVSKILLFQDVIFVNHVSPVQNQSLALKTNGTL